MECLNKILCGEYSLVGIRDFVNCAHPETILYINDIPGITLKSASAIANDEQRTGYNLLNDKIKLATKKIFHRFSSIVSDSFNFSSILVAKEIHNFTNTTHSPASLNRGLVIRRWRSEVARIYVEKLYIKVAESGIAIVTIKDGDLEKNYQVSLLGGITNEIDIRYKAKSEHIYITFDQTNFTTYGCKIVDTYGCTSCGTSRHHQGGLQLDVKGYDGSNEVYDCYGMGILANVQCYEEEILCQLLPRMAFMIWYQSGIEILQEHVASGRVNAVVNFTKDQARETLVDLEEDLKEEEKQFRKNITNFLKITRGECFTCNGNKSTHAIP